MGIEKVQQITNQIKNSTDPSLIVSALEIAVDSKTLLALSIDEFSIEPVSVKGRYLKRVGNSNHQMTSMEISQSHLQSLHNSWDAHPLQQGHVEELDMDKILAFQRKVNESDRFHLNGTPLENLEKLNLLQKGQLSQAA